MAVAKSSGLITALDIGSWKVSALIAEVGEGGDIQVLGTGQRESKGVRRGYIADMDATEKAIREAVEQAERIAGLSIDNVWVGFSAGGLVSNIASVGVELGGQQISQVDIDALLAAGRFPQPAGLPGMRPLRQLAQVQRPRHQAGTNHHAQSAAGIVNTE